LVERLVRAEKHAGRDRRQAQPRDQHGVRRHHDPDAVRRVGRAADHGLARRLREDHRRRHREVGEGDRILRRQGELTGGGAVTAGASRELLLHAFFRQCYHGATPLGSHQTDRCELGAADMYKLLAISLAVLAASSMSAATETYPSRPITMVVPFAAGGPLDTLARFMAERMRASLGQPVIIENVTGAGGSIGVGRVARATPDGYTL